MKRFPSIDTTAPLRSIMLIQLGDIGDVIITFPCIRLLREQFPDARILVAVREKTASLVDICPWADGAVVVSSPTGGWTARARHQFEFIRNLRRQRIDLVFDLLTGDRGAILAFLSGAPKRIGFYASGGTIWRNRIFTQLYRSPGIPGQRRMDYYRSLLEACGLRTANPMPEIPVRPPEVAAARALLAAERVPSDRPYVILQPFSLWPHKQWRARRWTRLIAWLSDTYRLSAVIIGSSTERAGAQAIIDDSGRDVCNLAGRTPLDILPAIFSDAALFVGIDSSGTHFAAAVGTPTVTLFGPTLSSAWGYHSPGHTIVTRGYTCIPCDKKGCDGSGASRCLRYLDTEAVIEAIDNQLKESCRSSAVGQ